MSNLLYRKLTIRRSPHEQLVIPRAQLLGLRWARTDKGQDCIEFRLSVGRVNLFGEQIDALWVMLVSGEVDIVDFNKPLEEGVRPALVFLGTQSQTGAGRLSWPGQGGPFKGFVGGVPPDTETAAVKPRAGIAGSQEVSTAAFVGGERAGPG